MMMMCRGDRKTIVVLQLPFKTWAAGGGGVPLSNEECDEILPYWLGKGVIVFTDGAGPYEALPAGNIKCSPQRTRSDCLRRAMAAGRAACDGWRPRQGEDRFRAHYRKLNLSHGVVTQSKEEWALINKIRVHTASGSMERNASTVPGQSSSKLFQINL